MATTHAFGFVHPNRTTAFLRHLAVLLLRDERRVRPPISLPGRPAPLAPPAEPPADRSAGYGSHFNGFNSRRGDRPTHSRASDTRGAYSRAQLVRMNTRFVRRLERAFARGSEQRASASASFHAAGDRP